MCGSFHVGSNYFETIFTDSTTSNTIRYTASSIYCQNMMMLVKLAPIILIHVLMLKICTTYTSPPMNLIAKRKMVYDL